MSKQKKESSKNILALYPNPKGFGYALMEDPLIVNHCQVVVIRPISNKKLMKRIREYIDYFKPSIVVLEDYNGKQSRKSKRVEHLIDQIRSEAKKRGIDIASYSRERIRYVFRRFDAWNKHEISEVIVRNIDSLKCYLRPKRLFYKSEPYTMGIFDAVALGVTHYYLTD